MSQRVEFHEETRFRKTKIGDVPQEWTTDEVRNLFDYYKGTTPSTKVPEYWNGDIPFVVPTDITELAEKNETYLERTQRCITKRGMKSKGLSLVPKDSLLLTSRATIGYPAVSKIEVTINQGIVSLTPKRNDIELLFYYYLFENLRNYLESLSGGSTFKEVSLTSLKRVMLPFPPFVEQQRVAAILSTIDEAIRKTNEIVTKTQELKKGLMQRLLTKGMGHTELKKTEIGEIPKEWDILKVGNVTAEARSGFACGKRDENGIIQLRMNSIETEGWINKEGYVKVPVPKDVEEYVLKPGDILFNNTNSADLIGKTAIFKGEIPRCVYSNHLTRIKVDPRKVISEWILFIFIRNWQLGIFKAIRHQHVHQAGINRKDLLSVKIPIPSLEEQEKIAEVLVTVDEKIEKERKTKEQFEKTKKWFMQNLLTGRIRVKVS